MPTALFLVFFVAPFISLVQSQCPGDMTYSDTFQKCYKYVSKNEAYEKAEHDCGQTYGGHLVSIHNGFENTFINTNVATDNKTNYWIGLNYITELALTWTDNTTVDYTNWSPAQPASPSATMCVFLRERELTWATELCHKKKHYVCEAVAIPGYTNPPTTPNPLASMVLDVAFLVDVSQSAANTYDDMSNFINNLMASFTVSQQFVRIALIPVFGKNLTAGVAATPFNGISSNANLNKYLTAMKKNFGDFNDAGQNLQDALNVATGSSFMSTAQGFRPSQPNHLIIYVTSTSTFSDNPSTASILKNNQYGIITVGYGSGIIDGPALESLSGGKSCYFFASNSFDLTLIIPTVQSLISNANSNNGVYCGNGPSS